MNSGRSMSAEEALQQMQVSQARATALSDMLRTQRNQACDENASLGVEITFLRATLTELRTKLESKEEQLATKAKAYEILLMERRASEQEFNAKIAGLESELETARAKVPRTKAKRSSLPSESRG